MKSVSEAIRKTRAASTLACWRPSPTSSAISTGMSAMRSSVMRVDRVSVATRLPRSRQRYQAILRPGAVDEEWLDLGEVGSGLDLAPERGRDVELGAGLVGPAGVEQVAAGPQPGEGLVGPRADLRVEVGGPHRV